ncbi:MAG: cyclic nucleotide-binding domain-containing protein [Lachnospiraceae bacterium]|nr:cyclic nucleotide-binding domain-containing protein [Lachnospiraceae bacterium]
MDIDKLAKCGKVRYFNADSFIVIEGNEGSTAFLVLKGFVGVVLGTFKDKNRIVARIDEGSFFGEMSMLEGAPRSATVMAGGGGVTVLEIGKDDFLKLMKTEPELAFKLLKTLYNRIEDTLNGSDRYMVAYAAEVRRDKTYKEISAIDLDQFKVIVAQREDYVLKLLTYMSHTLTKINRELMRRTSM